MDASDYQESLKFSLLAYNLLNNGCLGVVCLYHPPKYASDKKNERDAWTLENSILGSAGYGGILA